jgi:hypothetical protein
MRSPNQNCHEGTMGVNLIEKPLRVTVSSWPGKKNADPRFVKFVAKASGFGKMAALMI